MALYLYGISIVFLYTGKVNINDLHMLAKCFIRQHGSYNRDDLQDWMNLLWFILNKPNDKYAKVLKFIELAINTPTRVKYREAMKAKEPK